MECFWRHNLQGFFAVVFVVEGVLSVDFGQNPVGSTLVATSFLE